VALVGPYLSGKTTLLEAILFRTGATRRQGKISEKSTIGDASPEARGHGMSVELNVATTDYLGERYTFLEVAQGFLKDPATDRDYHTVGVSFKPIPNVAIKADYQFVSTGAGTGVDQFGLALGYSF
jgi:hypothetical protein